MFSEIFSSSSGLNLVSLSAFPQIHVPTTATYISHITSPIMWADSQYCLDDEQFQPSESNQKFRKLFVDAMVRISNIREKMLCRAAIDEWKKSKQDVKETNIYNSEQLKSNKQEQKYLLKYFEHESLIKRFVNSLQQTIKQKQRQQKRQCLIQLSNHNSQIPKIQSNICSLILQKRTSTGITQQLDLTPITPVLPIYPVSPARPNHPVLPKLNLFKFETSDVDSDNNIQAFKTDNSKISSQDTKFIERQGYCVARPVRINQFVFHMALLPLKLTSKLECEAYFANNASKQLYHLQEDQFFSSIEDRNDDSDIFKEQNSKHPFFNHHQAKSPKISHYEKLRSNIMMQTSKSIEKTRSTEKQFHSHAQSLKKHSFLPSTHIHKTQKKQLLQSHFPNISNSKQKQALNSGQSASIFSSKAAYYVNPFISVNSDSKHYH